MTRRRKRRTRKRRRRWAKKANLLWQTFYRPSAVTVYTFPYSQDSSSSSDSEKQKKKKDKKKKKVNKALTRNCRFYSPTGLGDRHSYSIILNQILLIPFLFLLCFFFSLHGDRTTLCQCQSIAFTRMWTQATCKIGTKPWQRYRRSFLSASYRIRPLCRVVHLLTARRKRKRRKRKRKTRRRWVDCT